MGLMLARISSSMSAPGPTMLATGAVGVGLGVGATNGIAYGYGKDLSEPQTKPEGMNHAVGVTGAAVSVLGGIAWVLEAPSRPCQKVMGLGLGAALGAYAIAPIVRRAMAD